MIQIWWSKISHLQCTKYERHAVDQIRETEPIQVLRHKSKVLVVVFLFQIGHLCLMFLLNALIYNFSSTVQVLPFCSTWYDHRFTTPGLLLTHNMLIEERAVPVLRNSCLACGGQEERELEEDKLVEDKLLEDKVERGREGEHHWLEGL